MNDKQSTRAIPMAKPKKTANLLWLAGVTVVHAALLSGAIFGFGTPSPQITPPTITGMLVSDSPAAATESPRQEQPVPVQKTVRTTSKQSTLPPVPNAPPSDHATTAPAAAPAPASSNKGSPGSGPVSLPRTDAAHLNNPKPVYPAVSRRMGEQGRVLLSVYILPNGSVGEIKLKQSCGYPRLDESAITAVRRWRYVPARRGNEPIPYWYVQPISFSLDS